MDRHITATLDAAPSATIAALSDLSTYPSWLTLVASAEPADVDTAEEAAWSVTLRARLGPFARSKRLRMVRTHLDDQLVRFERDENDGREHAEWVLEAQVDAATDGNGGSDVVVKLHYGGALWSAPLEIALASFEGDAAERLGAWIASPPNDLGSSDSGSSDIKTNEIES